MPASFTYGGDGRYLYVANTTDQTISIIDTSLCLGSGDMSAAVIATVTNTNTAGTRPFNSLRFRPTNKSVYSFGLSNVDLINADPSSGGFNTLSTIFFANDNLAFDNLAVAYNPNDDIFYMCEYRIDPSRNIKTQLYNDYHVFDLPLFQEGKTYCYKEGNYLFSGEYGIVIYKTDTKVLSGYLIDNESLALSQNKFGEMIYDSISNRIFINMSGYIMRIKADTFERDLLITAADANCSGICVAGRKLFAAANNSNKISVINLTTMTLTGSFTKANLATKETVTRSLIYSPYSDRVFAQASSLLQDATGVNRIHVFDPNQAVGAMDKGWITVGNMEGDLTGSGGTNGRTINQMCLNRLADWTAADYCDEYQAVLDRATTLGYTLPSPLQKMKEDAKLRAYKANGLWTTKDAIYNFWSDGSKEFCTLNWKNPATHQATIHGGLTWTALAGFSGNASNGYLNLHFDLSADGVNYVQNNAAILLHFPVIPTGSVDQPVNMYGVNNSGFNVIYLIKYIPDGKMYMDMNNNVAQSFGTANPSPTGLYHFYRNGATSQGCKKDGAAFAAGTDTSTGVPSGDVMLFCKRDFNNAAVAPFCDGTIGMIEIGSNLVSLAAAQNTIHQTFIS